MKKKKKRNFPTNLILVALREHDVAARCRARMYVFYVLRVLRRLLFIVDLSRSMFIAWTNIHFSALAKTENALIYPANEAGHAKRRKSPPCHQNRNRSGMKLCIMLSLRPRSLKNVRHRHAQIKRGDVILTKV